MQARGRREQLRHRTSVDVWLCKDVARGGGLCMCTVTGHAIRLDAVGFGLCPHLDAWHRARLDSVEVGQCPHQNLRLWGRVYVSLTPEAVQHTQRLRGAVGMCGGRRGESAGTWLQMGPRRVVGQGYAG